MHIADGLLDARTALAAAAAAAAGLGVALPRLERTLPPQRVPLLGLCGAFVFAAQLLNFPVGGGTSGHLIGSVLVTALLGPAAAVVVLTAVLLTQCLLFADGGVTALGANVFDMAVLAPAAAAPLLAGCRRLLPGPRGVVLGGAFAGWASVVLASIACAAQLALSGTAGFAIVLPAMLSVHMVIGIGEGLITALVLAALLRARPDLVAVERDEQARPLPWLLAVAALGVLLFVAPFASALPDGLEHVGAVLGFGTAAHAGAALLPEPATHSPVAMALLAAAAGAAVAFVLSWLLARALLRAPADASRS